jgi:D-alanyl-D-alanine dipeptidase
MAYNIAQRRNISLLAFIIFCACLQGFAQGNHPDSSRLRVLSTLAEYDASVAANPDQQMVDVTRLIPDIVLDLRYATINNFVGKRMYDEQPAYTFMRRPAASALALVQKDLRERGYGLKIFDAYRPYAVTRKFWDLVHDERYVANPSKGSGHNRGIAVDLTLIDLKTGRELVMPTGFDNFTDSAHHDFMNLSAAVLKNRALLKQTMEKYGFISFPTEWWHYSLPNPEKYTVLDLGFEELKNDK